MNSNSNDFTPIVCPMPDCGQHLHLVFTLARGLYEADLAEPDPADPGDAHTSIWQVECEDGHVVLLPAGLGCPCDDQGGPDCPHNDGDYDHSDDYRFFRAVDAVRLAALLAKFSTGGAEK